MRRLRPVRRVSPSHIDDWLITYADTITLLLCLFVVLLASQSRKTELAQHPIPVKPAEQQVATATVTNWTPPFLSAMPRIDVPQDRADAAADHLTPPRFDEDPFPPIPSPGDLRAAEITPATDPSTITTQVFEPASEPAAVADTVPEQAGIRPIPRLELPQVAKPAVDAEADQKGDRITTIVFDSTALFGKASATLNSSGKAILQDVVEKLKSEKYRDYMVAIEGHTDDSPINTAQFPSNWELSTARAGAVARFCVEQGIPAQRLRAAGYADTRPLQPNRDKDGTALPENQAKNRRVVIELEKVERR